MKNFLKEFKSSFSNESILLFLLAVVGLVIGFSGSMEAGIMVGVLIFGIWYRTKRS